MNKIEDKLVYTPLEKLLLEKYQAENADGQKVLNKTLVSAHAREYNADLLTLLQSDEDVKNHFFVKVNETTIFKLEKFLTFITNRSFLPDSFTAFKNKIGLATGKENYLTNSRDVVLNWAYKDCILEGGQTKDDQKRGEIFFNEILAPDQINRLLDDKVFTNFKRYDKNGEHEVKELNQNDNLIIKGNNLVVLHSLKKRFAGKVKLIYIDPPYNTGNDSFKYNDNFNHSTWLTFMKNRLEVAKDLLADDGVIFVQCDDNEQAYLKVLMDEIFMGNVDCIVWQKMDARYDRNTNAKIINRYKEVHEYILIGYKSNKISYNFNEIKKMPDWKNAQTNPDKDPRGDWQSGIISFEEEHEKEDKNSEYFYEVKSPSGVIWERQWFLKEDEMRKKILENKIYFGKSPEFKNVPRIKIFENEEQKYKMESILRGFGTTSIAKDEIEKLFNNRDLFSTPKPEKLIAELIRASTKENDIILDFFSGSGTTGAVAHKMNRQYILVEQMNYIHELPEARLKKVIAGEQGGISKSVNWQGGGDFVYCELANDAENFRNEVRNANVSELLALLEKAKASSFLSYRVDRESFNDFETLTENDQRKLLLQLVDTNTLYVNYTDIESKDYEISEADKKLNKQFYGK